MVTLGLNRLARKAGSGDSGTSCQASVTHLIDLANHNYPGNCHWQTCQDAVNHKEPRHNKHDVLTSCWQYSLYWWFNEAHLLKRMTQMNPVSVYRCPLSHLICTIYLICLSNDKCFLEPWDEYFSATLILTLAWKKMVCRHIAFLVSSVCTINVSAQPPDWGLSGIFLPVTASSLP